MNITHENWLDEQLEEGRKEYDTWPDWKKDCSRTGEYRRKQMEKLEKELLNKPVKDATDILKLYNKEYRIITEDCLITADFRPERIELFVEDGIVVEVNKG